MSDSEFLGRYRADRVLGTGGFATVWLATDETLDAQVAIKVLAENWAHDPNVRQRFTDEARILWRLDSPHVVRVYTVDELPDGRPFFVMEYADQGSLETRMQARTSAMPVADALAISRDIAEGLAAAHAQGVVHRDLKPSNVLFKGERLVLADFGIARSLEAAGATTIAAGTPHYMAPEQTEGRAGLPSDVYSAAVILYELLAGSVPFPFPTAGQVIRAQLMETAPDIRTVRPDVPAALAATLARGLDRDPDRRHQTVEEWRQALDGQGDEPTPAPPPPPTSPATLGPEDVAALRSEAGVPAAPIAAVGGAAAPPPPPPPTPGGYPPGGSPPPPPAGSGTDRRRRRRRQTVAALVAVLALIGGVIGISLVSAGGAGASIRRSPASEVGLNPFAAELTASKSLKPPSLLPFLKPLIAAASKPKAPPHGVPTFPGNTPGLYGGTQQLTVCDAKALVSFLLAHPDKAAAWAAVEGIAVSKIPAYVATLTDAILRTDTWVTNHGFVSGKASVIPEVLQAGTAVLIDAFGVPRARCYCGNPLTPPVTPKSTPKFTGPTWPGFDPATQTAITAVTTITKIVIVDVFTGSPFFRPAGTHGEADTPAPSDVLVGSPFAKAATAGPAPGAGGPAPANAVTGTYTVGAATPSGTNCSGLADVSGQQIFVNLHGTTVDFNFQGAALSAPYDPNTGKFALTEADVGGLSGAFTLNANDGVDMALTLNINGCNLALQTTRTGEGSEPPASETTEAPTTAPPTTGAVVQDVTSVGSASASSVFSGQFPVSNAVDGDPSTSWFSIGAAEGPDSTFTWQAPSDVHIASIGIVGNEGNADPANRSGFGYQQTEIQVLDANGAVVFDQTFDGPGATGNDINTPVNATGRTVKLLLKNRESPDCGGFADLHVLGSPA